MLTKEVAMSLKRGTKLYHNLVEFTRADGEKVMATATVTGKAKLCSANGFLLPIKRNYGNATAGVVTRDGMTLWRLTPEKADEDHLVIPEVTNVRKAPMVMPTHVPVAKPPKVEEYSTVVRRITRQRRALGLVGDGSEEIPVYSL